MAGPGLVLKEAHRLRLHIQDLENRIAQAPRQMQLQKTKLLTAEDNLKKAQDEIRQLKLKILDREGAVKSTFQQISKWEKQRESAANQKEFTALDHEIAQAKEKVQALEDEIFEAMSLVEERAAQLPKVEAATQQVRSDVAKFEQDYDARIAKLTAEKTSASEELKGVDVQLPEDIVPVYQKLVKNKGADSLAQIEGRNCTACYTELTPQNASEVGRGVFVICKSCGRMLYA